MQVVASDGVKEFLIEDADMLHGGVIAVITHVVCIHGPMDLRAVALFAEIVGERTHFEEAEEGEELSDTILNRRAGEAPLIGAL